GLLQQHAAPRGGMKEAEIHSTGPGLTVQISETTSLSLMGRNFIARYSDKLDIAACNNHSDQYSATFIAKSL
ncbi:MAG: hypothetical protein OEL76_17840, partial [Siculibacillus sp.]|nr:hypothetical protein [Siculibacillus sp.]